MLTAQNLRLLAALLAPTDSAGAFAENLLFLTPPYPEADPRPAYPARPVWPLDRVLGRFINLDEISEGWAWEDETPEATPENYRERLIEAISKWLTTLANVMPGTDTAADYYERGEEIIAQFRAYNAAYEATQPAYEEWLRNKTVYDVTAPRLVYADELLRAAGIKLV